MKRNKWLLSLAVGLLCCGSAYAQTTVKGKITSESGEPLIGATIAVKKLNRRYSDRHRRKLLSEN